MERAGAVGSPRDVGRGFTLIELMIAMALLAFLSIGLLTTVNLIGRAQRTATAIDVAQSGVRASLELISRDVESAAAGARTGAVNYANGTPAQLLAVRVTDNSNGTGPDQLDLIAVDPSAQATLLAPYATGQTVIQVSTNSGFKSGDFVQVSDLSTAVVAQVTSLGNSGGNPALNIFANANALPKTFAAGAYVFRSRAISYYIDTAAFGAQNPLLMFDPDGPGALPGQPLAEGVEDFQVALGYDFNNDGVLVSVGSAAGDDDWVFNVAGETAPATLTQLRAVRVTIVARTVLPSAGTRGTRPAVEDHAGAPSADSYARRVVKSEISVRNFNL